jgi:hypothetical protein
VREDDAELVVQAVEQLAQVPVVVGFGCVRHDIPSAGLAHKLQEVYRTGVVGTIGDRRTNRFRPHSGYVNMLALD